ncbi:MULTISPECIES: glycosyltransferase [Escherichia]|uniref:glycosyltransferase n=1 Tax=Escherichia TaxID=561 RepID=UPI000A1D4E2E|nr:glycosyltransferase [Escherichia coli]ARM79331.1 hypothetical protein B9W17_11820 [Escherichia coli]AUY81250.1 hypothetical protein BWI84_13510 [Escherichia coli]EFO4744909.1 glycosyltransferase [Escherichia coli]EJE4860539.1 glycosyltransferase [Escherichia coli]EKE1111475.1 glycosyltransferase [Escherichia coli]
MLVSIAMTTYNGALYVKQQLRSLVSQTYKNIEIVIVDDCSTDSTIEIIEEFADERIILIKNDSNIGCTLSFQKAIELCRGDYIALCDQDDVWMLNKIEILLKEIGEHSLAYSNYSLIDKEGNSIKNFNRYVNKLHGMDSSFENFELYALFNSFILGCSIMFDKAIVKNILPIFDNGSNHDKWIVFQAALENGVKYVNKELFMYRIHGTNYSFQKRKVKRNNIMIYFPYDVLLQYKLNEKLNDKYNTILNIVKNFDEKRLSKIKAVIKYYRFIGARYNYYTKIKQLIKFVVVS